VKSSFESELEVLINRHSVDSHMSMHDFVIANMIIGILDSVRSAMRSEARLKG
jgi:hypothetical protein